MLRNLLLVDDDAFSFKMLEDLLRNEWKIISETTVEQIFKRMDQQLPNLVLLNGSLRRTDGESTFDAIYKRYPSVPIVVFTNMAQARMGRSLVKRGAFWHLLMPLNTDDLQHVMKMALAIEDQQKSAVDARKDFEHLEEGIARLFSPLKDSFPKTITFEEDDLLQGILDLLGDILQVEKVSLMLIDHETKELRIKAAKGLTPYVIQNTVKKIGEGIAGHVAREGKPLLIKDVQQDPKFSESAFYHQYTTRSLVCVPMKAGDRVIGILSANNKYSGRSLDENDLYMATIFSHLLMLTLHNAQLHFDRERMLSREAELAALSRKLSVSLEPKVLFQTLLSECCSIFGAEFAFLFSLSEKTTECAVFYLGGNKFQQNMIAGAALQKWLPLRVHPNLISAESDHKDFELLKSLLKQDVRNWLCAPITLQDRLAGSLELASFDPKKFREADKQTLSRIAQQASLAINNARLYEKLLNSLKEISDARKEVDRIRRGQFL